MRATEQEIRQHLLCPMMSMPEKNLLHGVITELERWAIFEAFEGRIPPARNIRFKFERLWKGICTAEGLDETAFYDGLRMANTATLRIVMLLERHAIVRPITPYQVQVGEHWVEGEYALILRHHNHKTKELPSILMTWLAKPKYFHAPDPIELVRYLHLMSDSDLLDAHVYHLPLLKGEPWRHTGFELPLVRKSVDSILRSLQAVNHPRPGSHCDSCREKKCRSLWNG